MSWQDTADSVHNKDRMDEFMWSYIDRGQSHYEETLSDCVNSLLIYYVNMSSAIAGCKNVSHPGPYDYSDWIYLYDDYFKLVITEDVPVSEQPDELFGKGNGYVCCKIDPNSPFGKTIYVKAKDYAIHLLEMFKEQYDYRCEGDTRMEYRKYDVRYSCSKYIELDFYALTI